MNGGPAKARHPSKGMILGHDRDDRETEKPHGLFSTVNDLLERLADIDIQTLSPQRRDFYAAALRLAANNFTFVQTSDGGGDL